MGIFSEKLMKIDKKEFNSLINDDIINDVIFLESNHQPPSFVAIEKSFITNDHKIIFGTLSDNGYFDSSGISSELLKERMIMQLDLYKDKYLTEKIYGFNTTYLENSYDLSLDTRIELKNVFDNWYPYSEEILKNSLNYFDGDGSNYLNSVSYHPEGQINSLICHEFPTGDYIRDKTIIENLCRLFQITETNEDIEDLGQIIEKIEPLLAKVNLKINFLLKYTILPIKELAFTVYPANTDVRTDIIHFCVNSFTDLGYLSEKVATQLKSWELFERKFGFLKFKIYKEEKIKIDISASYGVI